MKKTVKIITFILAVIVTLTAAVSCSSYGENVMTVADKGISVNTYQLLLSRMKGTLATYGYDVENERFWRTVISSDGTTYNDYFTASIVEQASRYVIADYLFDRNGLVLTKDRIAIVDKLMDAYVKKAGSKNALNAKLKDFGANYDVLRELLLLETKIDMLKDHLYGEKGEKIETEVKELYLKDNYVAFGQILLTTYDYIIDTDEFGDQVYYTDEKHTAIAYDTVNGVTKLDEFGKPEKDILGNPAYFTEDGKIAYDKKNGVLGYATDEKGNKKIKKKSAEEIAEIEKKVETYMKATDGKIDAFIEHADIYGEGESDGEITYLFSSTDYYASINEELSYLDKITEKLEKMETGEVSVVQSDKGFHIICKYDLESGAYDDKALENDFSDFYVNLIALLFDEECKIYESSVVVNEEVLNNAPTIAEIGTNTLY
jgi:hypothetical protein